ncbi:hypothetical protein QTQ03_06725 [Micromonospora sp. WMMA1363]|uniref:hypothetical protein n=1 Tax=Micromonospora sp. WMMA1363 TaxID=3053985 RepID=UPI00259D151A|nr:hypothetical protein [Micromonospora sp. WMMA1363]MDM4719305.1 hypothetical protein [Micromonospora sp. WMMA1363]
MVCPRADWVYAPPHRAVVAVDVQPCHVGQRGDHRSGRVDEACKLAAEAFDVGQTYDSERVTRAVATFRNTIGARSSRAVTELDERLYATYREER